MKDWPLLRLDDLNFAIPLNIIKVLWILNLSNRIVCPENFRCQSPFLSFTKISLSYFYPILISEQWFQISRDLVPKRRFRQSCRFTKILLHSKEFYAINLGIKNIFKIYMWTLSLQTWKRLYNHKCPSITLMQPEIHHFTSSHQKPHHIWYYHHHHPCKYNPYHQSNHHPHHHLDTETLATIYKIFISWFCDF